jgi:hypothetical protein
MACRHCYQNGHNQRTCPTLTEIYEKQAAIEEQNGKKGWYTQQLAARRAKTGKKLAAQHCGYCTTQGHTRRTCEALKKDIHIQYSQQTDRANVYMDYVDKWGIGPGSLLQVTESRWMGGEYRKVTYEAIATDVRIHQHNDALSVDMNALVVDFKAFGNSGADITIRMSTLFDQNKSDQGWQSWFLLSEEEEKWNVGDDWRDRQVGTLENLSKRPLFKRIGQKYNDERDYAFRKFDLIKRRANDENEVDSVRQDMEDQIWTYSAAAMRKAMEARWDQSCKNRQQRLEAEARPSKASSDDIPF